MNVIEQITLNKAVKYGHAQMGNKWNGKIFLSSTAEYRRAQGALRGFPADRGAPNHDEGRGKAFPHKKVFMFLLEMKKINIHKSKDRVFWQTSNKYQSINLAIIRTIFTEGECLPKRL